jgi:hypothetical protein
MLSILESMFHFLNRKKAHQFAQHVTPSEMLINTEDETHARFLDMKSVSEETVHYIPLDAVVA